MIAIGEAFADSGPDKSLKDFGFTDEDFAADDIEVFPENWPALQVYLAMQSQMRVGMKGATGLDYSVLPIVEQRLRIPRAKQQDVFFAIRIIESAYLSAGKRSEENNEG